MYKLVKLHTISMLKPLRKENIKGFSKKKGFCSQAATFLVRKIDLGIEGFLVEILTPF